MIRLRQRSLSSLADLAHAGAFAVDGHGFVEGEVVRRVDQHMGDGDSLVHSLQVDVEEEVVGEVEVADADQVVELVAEFGDSFDVGLQKVEFLGVEIFSIRLSSMAEMRSSSGFWLM